MLVLAGTSYQPATCLLTKISVAYFATPSAYRAHVGVTPPMYIFCLRPIIIIPGYWGLTALFGQLLVQTLWASHTSQLSGPCC